jgi:hypothetical protein
MAEKGKEYKSDNKKLIAKLEQCKAQYEKNTEILSTNYQIKVDKVEKEKE